MTRLLLFFLAALLPQLAYAHVGAGGAEGLLRGIAHPLGGIDHLLAMVAVGLWAAQRGGRALWLIPAAFVLVMAAGGIAGTLGAPLPFVEQGILASLLVLGLLIAAAARLPLPLSTALVGLFALFHGHAHGAEMPAHAPGLVYGAGFVLATAFLHAAGIGAAFAGRRLGQALLVRLSGGLIAGCGAYLLTVSITL